MALPDHCTRLLTYTSLTCQKTICSDVSDFTDITIFKLRDVHFRDEDCRLLARSLQDLCRLQELNLSDNPLGQLGIRELAKHLTSVTYSTYLELWNTKMGKEEDQRLRISRCSDLDWNRCRVQALFTALFSKQSSFSAAPSDVLEWTIGKNVSKRMRFQTKTH